jgi:hypothetical protein
MLTGCCFYVIACLPQPVDSSILWLQMAAPAPAIAPVFQPLEKAGNKGRHTSFLLKAEQEVVQFISALISLIRIESFNYTYLHGKL